jgi:hypothetical protein
MKCAARVFELPAAAEIWLRTGAGDIKASSEDALETPFKQSLAEATTEPSLHATEPEPVGVVGDGAAKDITGRFAVKPDIEANPEFDPPVGTCETDESILVIMVTADPEGELVPPDIAPGIQYHPPLQ